MSTSWNYSDKHKPGVGPSLSAPSCSPFPAPDSVYLMSIRVASQMVWRSAPLTVLGLGITMIIVFLSPSQEPQSCNDQPSMRMHQKILSKTEVFYV